MFQNSFGLVLFYAPFVLIALFWVVVFLILRKNNFVLNPGLKKWFVFLAVLCGALHPIFFTVYQYYLWVNNAFTKILLTLPLDEKVPLFGVFQLFSFARDLAGGYFIYYSVYHFWLAVFVGFVLALIVYLFGLVIKKNAPGQVNDDELWLLFLGCLFLPWPLGFVFIILFFTVLIVTAIVSIFFGEKQIVGFLPMIFLCLVMALVFYDTVLSYLHLGWLVL
jgi:hypothetical protein